LLPPKPFTIVRDGGCGGVGDDGGGASVLLLLLFLSFSLLPLLLLSFYLNV